MLHIYIFIPFGTHRQFTQLKQIHSQDGDVIISLQMHLQGLWDTLAIYTAKTNPVEEPGCKNICITMFYPVRSK